MKTRNGTTILGLLASLLITLFLSQSVSAQAGAATFGAALDVLEAKINNMVNNAGYESRSTVYATGQQARLAVEAVRTSYRNELNNSMAKVNAAARQAFDKAELLVKTADDAVTRHLDKTSQITTEVTNLVQSLPFVKNCWVSGYSPKLACAKFSDRDFFVQVKGFGFTDKARLILGGYEYKPTGVVANQLDFTVPASFFRPGNNSTGVIQKACDLILENKDQNWIDAMVGKNRTYSAKLAFYILPKEAGSFVVTLVESNPKREFADRQTELFTVSTDGQQTNPWNGKEKGQTFPTTVHAAEPAPENTVERQSNQIIQWHIDPASLKWKQVSTPNPNLGEYSFRGFIDVTDLGFRTDLFAKTKCCFRGRSWITGYATYREYRDFRELNTLPAYKTGKLLWGQSVPALTIPNNAESIKIELTSYDGSKYITSKDADFPIAKVIWNSTSTPKDLTINTVSVNNAIIQ